MKRLVIVLFVVSVLACLYEPRIDQFRERRQGRMRDGGDFKTFLQRRRKIREVDSGMRHHRRNKRIVVRRAPEKRRKVGGDKEILRDFINKYRPQTSFNAVFQQRGAGRLTLSSLLDALKQREDRVVEKVQAQERKKAVEKSKVLFFKLFQKMKRHEEEKKKRRAYLLAKFGTAYVADRLRAKTKKEKEESMLKAKLNARDATLLAQENVSEFCKKERQCFQSTKRKLVRKVCARYEYKSQCEFFMEPKAVCVRKKTVCKRRKGHAAARVQFRNEGFECHRECIKYKYQDVNVKEQETRCDRRVPERVCVKWKNIYETVPVEKCKCQKMCSLCVELSCSEKVCGDKFFKSHC